MGSEGTEQEDQGGRRGGRQQGRDWVASRVVIQLGISSGHLLWRHPHQCEMGFDSRALHLWNVLLIIQFCLSTLICPNIFSYTLFRANFNFLSGESSVRVWIGLTDRRNPSDGYSTLADR